MIEKINRRALIGALAGAPVIAATTIAGTAEAHGATSNQPSLALLALIRKTDETSRVCDIIEARHTGLRERWLAECEAIPADMVGDERKAEIERLSIESGLRSATEEANRLGDVHCAAIYAVQDFPAATIADLIAKMALLDRFGWIEDANDGVSLLAIVTDVRRLFGEG